MIKHLYTEQGTVNNELLDKPVVIYGCGKDGRNLIRVLKDQGVAIKALFDSNNHLWGSSIEGVQVHSVEELSIYKEYNIALPFFLWPEVIGSVQDIFENIYVDFPYEKNSTEKCIICGGECREKKAHFAPFIVERMFKGENVQTKLLRCLNCNTQFSFYRPNDEEMSNLYSGYRDEEYQQMRCKTEEYDRDVYYNDEIENIRRKELEDFLGDEFDYDSVTCLLDYGGDEGQFIPFRFKNADKYIYEISGNKTRDGVQMINEFETISDHVWDFVMCCHVLEHVSEPLIILDKIISSISSGFFYLELPCETFMNSYSDAEINEHINFYNKKSLEEIARIYNLEIVKMEIKTNNLKVLYKKEN